MISNLESEQVSHKEQHEQEPRKRHRRESQEDPEIVNVDTSAILNKSSPINMPRRIIIEKHKHRKDKRSVDSTKYVNHSNNGRGDNTFSRSRYSTRNKTREKRNKIFSNLLRPNGRQGKLSHNNSNLRNQNGCYPLSNTHNRVHEPQDTSSRAKLNSRNVGYGEVFKLIQKKKTRIQSAHPIMKELAMHNKDSTNLNESYTFHQNITENRPISSAKSSMRDYLNKIIVMANKR